MTAEGFGEELSPGLKSVREALVNMLMHADYFSPAHPRVRIFSNHIEYYNPGGLPKPLAELKGKDLSIPRNPILAKLFRMVKLAENAGYGLDKIEHNWKEYNGTSVDYVIDFDSTIVKLRTKIEELPTKYRPSTDEVPQELRSTSVEVQDLINVLNGEMSRKEIQLALALKHEGNFRENYLEPSLAAGLIRMKYPNSPNHPKQKYLLTEEGMLLKTSMK